MPTSRVIVILYTFATTAHVMASATGPASLAWATAPLLMPLLVGVVIFAAVEGGHRPNAWLLTGLALATIADVLSLAGPGAARLVLVAGSLACYAVAALSVRQLGRLEWWLGLALLMLSEVLLAVRLSAPAGLAVAAVPQTLAYGIGQVLVVTGWIRRPVGTPRVPNPRTPVEVLSRR
jgi:hypothetical protein